MEIKLWSLNEPDTTSWLSGLGADKPLYKKADNAEILAELDKQSALESITIDGIEAPKWAMEQEEPNLTDVDNIKIMYEAMGKLPRKYAASQSFWAGAAHTFGWDYIHYHEPSAHEFPGGEIPDNFYTHYFYKNDKGRAHLPFMNCLSRLWWAGYLLHDDSQEDPWVWLRAVPRIDTSFTSHILIIGSSNLCARKENIIGTMRALKKLQDKGVDLKREHLVVALRYLNSIGSSIVLDYLSAEQIEEHVTQCLELKFSK